MTTPGPDRDLENSYGKRRKGKAAVRGYGETRSRKSGDALVTVVVPTYRRPGLLRRAIESVLAQTWGDFRICIYDNASGDETGEVARHYAATDPRVEYYCHPRNTGLVHNFIFGIDSVRTPWFLCLSDDDLIFPRFLEAAMAGLGRHPGAAMFLGGTVWANPAGGILDVIQPRSGEECQRPPDAFLSILRQRFGWTSAVISYDAVRRLGGIDPSVGEFMDFYLLIRVASRYPVVFSNEPCGVLFEGGTQAGLKIVSLQTAMSKTRESLGADRELDPAIKRISIDALNELTERSIFNWGVSRMSRMQRFADAEAATAILRDMGARASRIRVLKLMRSRSSLSALARAGFRLAYDMRQRVRRLAKRRVWNTCRDLLCDALRALPSGRETGPDAPAMVNGTQCANSECANSERWSGPETVGEAKLP